ncbi:hypothetical protein [Paucibacter sp. Y2R2-4]|uniref:hypothetical protein n=1 Tax=Paucibacter sp. Y2R2-4 TaxID=2893553 RepID=UPI0021E40FB2|nr:hypothetical protein [Paucibacter sp. Y2R2-4]MCV2350604.1 hypothetical protein [Paucibacter sp. Y2R2-4]
MKSLLIAFLAALKGLLRFVLALLILFEEWGWAPLSRAMARLGALPIFRQLEQWVGRVSPPLALLVLLAPTLLLLPVKLLALWLIGAGRAGLGLLLIVLAKLIGTAIVARLFQLTRPALLQMPWFARLYARWTAWKGGLLNWVRASAAWRWSRALKLRVRRALRRFV